MKTHDFWYDLPEELIAQTPLERRDGSRLMVLNRETGEIQHKHFYDVIDYLNPGDCLVMNDSRVLPARLMGHRPTGGVVEVLLLRDLGNKCWECLCKPGRKMQAGNEVIFGDGELTAVVREVQEDGNRVVEFKYEGIFLEVLERLGKMPLPPYIKEELQDQERYQTVYSKVLGSAAAPTAGLHFTPELLEKIEAQGVRTLCINTGVFTPSITPDVSNREIAAAAGVDMDEIIARKDRAMATAALAEGMEKLLPRLYAQGKLDGIISIGGSGGTSMVTPAMRALPLGVPKVMVSTMASGDVSAYVGTSDIMMLPAIVDVEGLNQISMTVFNNAVNAIVGMVKNRTEIVADGRPLLAATMFGVTTPCIKTAKAYLEAQGYEVLVFHATGSGGRTMEDLIRGGFIKGVLDITTTEWCDEVVGGVLTAGPHRLEAAAAMGIPQVVSVGALDMVNFGPYETVPEKFKGRKLYRHNPTVTLMRTTAEEMRQIGSKIAEKLNLARGKTVLLLPRKGLSGIDVEGAPFYDAQADEALFETLREKISSRVELIEMENAVNDEAFAMAAAQKLIELMKNKTTN